MTTRHAVVDVHYDEAGGAAGACLVYADRGFGVLLARHRGVVPSVAPYVPGSFADRELPVLRPLVGEAAPIDLLVVDGYVDLDPTGRPGLGRRAHEAFGVPVIGIAKTPFRAATHAAEVRRGSAERPVYVTAAGVDPADAAALVAAMAGPYRLPDAVREVDRLARSG